MKISELTLDYIYDYLRLDDPSTEEKADVQVALDTAKAYVQNYTGKSLTDLDSFEDVTQAILLLVVDFFDNRNGSFNAMQYSNKAIETILGFHQYSLLPESDEE